MEAYQRIMEGCVECVDRGGFWDAGTHCLTFCGTGPTPETPVIERMPKC